jgi:hypothetical protein
VVLNHSGSLLVLDVRRWKTLLRGMGVMLRLLAANGELMASEQRRIRTFKWYPCVLRVY